MVRITRVYTRTGDAGHTALVGGKRVSKDAQRIEAYGTIDELNSVIGLARAFNTQKIKARRAHRFLDEILGKIQDELFDLGSELATPAESVYEGMYRVAAPDVKRIEQIIDRCQKDLRPLESFVLPGGGEIGASLHQCRTVCRRAEREIFRLSREEAVGEWPLKYVNRLSDLFFVLARWIGKQTGEKEVIWRGRLRGNRRKRK